MTTTQDRQQLSHALNEIRAAAMVAYRELLRFRRARGRMLTSLIQPLAFLLILGFGLGQLVEATSHVGLVHFMLPGVVAMSVVTAALINGVSVVIDQQFGFMREMLVAPARRGALVLGRVAGGAVVATAQGALLLVLAPLIGLSLGPGAVLHAIGIVVIVAVALTAFGVLLATWITSMETFQAVLQLILTPMIFLSGAIFPLRDLPLWLAIPAYANPLTYAVDPLRQVLLPAEGAGRFAPGLEIFGWTVPFWAELGAVAVLAVVFAAMAVRSFGKPE